MSGTELLTALGKKPREPLDSASLDNLDDLTHAFAHYFKKGAAAERTFTDQELYRHIIDTAEKLPVKNVSFTLVMFIKMGIKLVRKYLFQDRGLHKVNPGSNLALFECDIFYLVELSEFCFDYF